MEQKKQHRQTALWLETHEILDNIVDFYNDQQKAEFGKKAKKVSKAALIHELAKMKQFEITQQCKDK